MEFPLLMVAIMIGCAVSYTEGQVLTSLTTNITTSGCGTSKLCVSQPTSCNPAGNTSCYFASSSVLPSNTSLFLELSGTTSGYVAVGLTTNQTQGPIVFVCGNNNNSFFYQTAVFSNGSGLISVNSTNINSVQGAVTGNQSLVQCTFNTTSNLTAITTRGLNAYLTLYQGNVSFPNGTLQLGVPVTVFSSGLLDLTNPSSGQNTTTTVATTTVATQSTTKGGTSSLVSSAHGLVIMLSATVFYLLH